MAHIGPNRKLVFLLNVQIIRQFVKDYDQICWQLGQ